VVKRAWIAVGLVMAMVLGGLTAAGTTATASSQPKRLVFRNVQVPFSKTFAVPRGTTMVTVDAQGGESLLVKNAKSLRPRCYLSTIVSWNARTATKRCQGLTAIDPPGTKWLVEVTGTGGTATVNIDFSSAPLPAPFKKVRFDRLSMPRYKVGKTEDLYIESFDGTMLHAQLTRPKTSKKVPVVIVSSPYNKDEDPERYDRDHVEDWVPRGYALLVADVRGFNYSGGCVEVWGPNEQQDQVELVKWAAAQKWSSGKVGFMGKSYVGTTPVQAAAHAPKALKAIAAIAPVVSAYEDWHYGGVPNQETALSPATYQALYGVDPKPEPTEDPLTSLINAGNGLCDPTLAARANDPRAIYDEFYKERDFAAMAKDVKASVLYIHGYEDLNVKANVYKNYFNDLRVPKLGLFGHFDHIWPPQAYGETLLLAWMDQYLMGTDLNLESLPNALVVNDRQEEHALDSWPVKKHGKHVLFPSFADATLASKGADGNAEFTLAPQEGDEQRLTIKMSRSVELAGVAALDLVGELQGTGNAYIAAELWEKSELGENLITRGMANLAHRNGHDKYEPVLPNEVFEMALPFVPTDHVFERGDELILVIRAASASEVSPSQPGRLILHGGKAGTRLVLPTLPVGSGYKSPLVDWR
jgi:predicted acyl esterase